MLLVIIYLYILVTNLCIFSFQFVLLAIPLYFLEIKLFYRFSINAADCNNCIFSIKVLLYFNYRLYSYKSRSCVLEQTCI